MDIFKILTNGILKKKSMTGDIQNIDLSDAVVKLRRSDEVSFDSDEMVDISKDDYIDTTDEESVGKYKNNIRLLIENARKKGFIDKYVTIREDDSFPYDWKWRVASSSSASEYGKCNLTYKIRMSKAEEMVSPLKDSPIKVPVDEKKLYAAASSIDPMYGRIMMPCHFRSTKHFTINTPLGYTGTYNSGISSDRDFIVIDDISNFINSGYGYSADYMDAYMDITHEELPISDSAVVLINDDRYEDIIRDREIKEQLSGRRVIRYKGDESLAINMALSEMGVLPSKPGGMCDDYDDDVRMILENSMRTLCAENNLLYAQGHGNINGVGGHFSDLYDSMYVDNVSFSERLSTFLKNYFPEYADIIKGDIVKNPDKIVDVIGADRINGALLLFNDIEKKRTTALRKKYDIRRDMLTDDEKKLFRETVSLINKYYSNELSRNNDFEIRELIALFYHSSDVDSQISAARDINSYIHKQLGLDSGYVI